MLGGGRASAGARVAVDAQQQPLRSQRAVMFVMLSLDRQARHLELLRQADWKYRDRRRRPAMP